MTFAGLVVLGYLLGSCPWGYWLVRLIKHEDVRSSGSGNIGATNVWRTYGRWLGAPVVLLDTLKRRFTKVAHVKPPASRADSAEMYVLALGFKSGAG